MVCIFGPGKILLPKLGGLLLTRCGFGARFLREASCSYDFNFQLALFILHTDLYITCKWGRRNTFQLLCRYEQLKKKLKNRGLKQTPNYNLHGISIKVNI